MTDPTPFPTQLPTANQDAVHPLGTFIIPHQYIQGLTEPKLEPLESRMIEEICRLRVWIQSLETQLGAAHGEIGRLNAVVAKDKKAEED